VTDQYSFENINYWMKNIQKHANAGVSMIIVGNKTDLEGARVVNKQQGQAVAAEHRVRYFETSAKDGSGVIDAFNGVGFEVLVRLLDVQHLGLDTRPHSVDGVSEGTFGDKKKQCSVQ
jgi:GTPase SAR1 family protein